MEMLSFLDWSFYGNPLRSWGLALLVLVLAYLGGRLLLRLVAGRAEAVASRTGTELPALLGGLLRKTHGFVVGVFALWVASTVLTLPVPIPERLRTLVVVAFLVQTALWATEVVNFVLTRYRERQVEEDPGAATAVGALGFLARVGLWSLFALLILDNLGVQITALIAGMGVGGIAVALALQNVLGDLFGSLSIVFDRPFVIGDFIIVDDLMGTVEYVGLKTTRIRSLSGEQLVFSNSDLLSSRVRNFKRMDERRVLFHFGVTYDTGYDRLKEIPSIVEGLVEADDNARFDRCHFQEYGDSALVFETVYFMLVPDFNAFMDSQEKINLELYRIFGEKGIEFAFPTRTVHLEWAGPAPAEPRLAPESRSA